MLAGVGTAFVATSGFIHAHAAAAGVIGEFDPYFDYIVRGLDDFCHFEMCLPELTIFYGYSCTIATESHRNR
jgi:hypothetical protein